MTRKSAQKKEIIGNENQILNGLSKIFSGYLALYVRREGNTGESVQTAACDSLDEMSSLISKTKILDAQNAECKIIFSANNNFFQTIEKFDNIIQTSPLFWDCNCADNYIQTATPFDRGEQDRYDVICALCGMNEEESPNARINEIMRLADLSQSTCDHILGNKISISDHRDFIVEDHF